MAVGRNPAILPPLGGLAGSTHGLATAVVCLSLLFPSWGWIRPWRKENPDHSSQCTCHSLRIRLPQPVGLASCSHIPEINVSTPLLLLVLHNVLLLGFALLRSERCTNQINYRQKEQLARCQTTGQAQGWDENPTF